ncbi:MAG: phytoene/squalene synthase family protein [Rubrivivax sp.]|nr:phytoene/squalene synthase family protein [Rubrivivax sp.]
MSSTALETTWPDPATLPRYDAALCRTLMRGGSKTFFAASLLLPPRVRAPASALYAYCRLADDLVDLGSNALQAVAQLHQRLDAVYAGRPQAIEVDRALAHVVHRFRIPRQLLDALIEGFLWDSQGRRYDTLAQLHDYAARVAGTVGAMMALLMGVRSPAALARACDLGVAMQLTNIARDVGEDARNGRLYLPREWLAEAGVDAQAWLQAPVFNRAIAGVVQRLLQAADALYARADAGVAALPRDCRPAIRAARLVYAEIGRALERLQLDAINHRAVVSPRRKLTLIARASAAAVHTPAGAGVEAQPPLPAVQFLVDAAVQAAPVATRRFERGFDERVGWVIGLAERHATQLQSAGL